MTKNSRLDFNPLIDLSRYMELKYRSGARGEDGYIDCWGLSRAVRFEECGKSLLPAFHEARHGKKGSIQAAYEELINITDLVRPSPGVIAAVLRKGICVHVAVVVGDGDIFEIKRSGNKPRVLAISDWIRDYDSPLWEVTFHD